MHYDPVRPKPYCGPMTERQTLICQDDACEIQAVPEHAVSATGHTLHIEMVSDWVCPYCPVGEANLREALQAFPDLEVTFQYTPYMLNPDLPEQGADRQAYLQEKGADPAKVRENEQKYTEMAAQVGWIYRYDLIKRSPNTLNAHRLAAFAAWQGKQLEIGHRLFAAHFTEGRNLSDLEVLLDIAQADGLDRETVRCYLQSQEDREEIRSRALAQKPIRGIRGVPSFFLNGELAVTGAEPVEVFRQAIVACLNGSAV
ncbi:DsbA family oxidoreductase [Deinococcus cellulosilyticus]|nr:DsbA family oxidoreductase [Deinococcus cellulosilyticus]